MVPLLPPKQLIDVVAIVSTMSKAGCPNNTWMLSRQRWASPTPMICNPADNPEKEPDSCGVPKSIE
jgi:hypothetical protein